MKTRKFTTVLLTAVILISTAIVPTVAQSSAAEKDPNIIYRTVSEFIPALSPDRNEYPNIFCSASTETEHYEITLTVYRDASHTDITITEKLSRDTWTIKYKWVNLRHIKVCFEDKNGDIIVIFSAGKNADIALLIDVAEQAIANEDIVTDMYYNMNTGELWTNSFGEYLHNLHTKEIVNIPDNVEHGWLNLFYVSDEGEISFSITTNPYEEENKIRKYYIMSKKESSVYETKLIEAPETGTPTVPLLIAVAAAFAVVIYKRKNSVKQSRFERRRQWTSEEY